jgi:hypothetical protein
LGTLIIPSMSTIWGSCTVPPRDVFRVLVVAESTILCASAPNLRTFPDRTGHTGDNPARTYSMGPSGLLKCSSMAFRQRSLRGPGRHDQRGSVRKTTALNCDLTDGKPCVQEAPGLSYPAHYRPGVCRTAAGRRLGWCLAGSAFVIESNGASTELREGPHPGAIPAFSSAVPYSQRTEGIN